MVLSVGSPRFSGGTPRGLAARDGGWCCGERISLPSQGAAFLPAAGAAAGPSAARGRMRVWRGLGIGNETSGKGRATDPVFSGCRLLQLTSVQLGQFTVAEGVILVSFKGNKCLEKRENASFSLQTIGFVCLNFLLSSHGLQAAKLLALNQSYRRTDSADVRKGGD